MAGSVVPENPGISYKPEMCAFFLIPFITFAATLPVQADVYKCRLPNGQTEISSLPCNGGSTIAVRPEERITEEARQSAEQDLARARAFIEKREANQRADDASELERARLNAAQQRNPLSQGRNYSNTDQCLRDVDQMVLDAIQRSSMEADCRRIGGSAQTTPQTIYVPVQHYTPPATVIVVPPRPTTPAPPPARMILKRPGS